MDYDAGSFKKKRPWNTAEADFYDQATADGWEVSKTGWPDFFMLKGNQVACVEVKRAKGHSLKRHQKRILRALANYGVPCYLWTPNGGFVRIRPLASGPPPPSVESLDSGLTEDYLRRW